MEMFRSSATLFLGLYVQRCLERRPRRFPRRGRKRQAARLTVASTDWAVLWRRPPREAVLSHQSHFFLIRTVNASWLPPGKGHSLLPTRIVCRVSVQL